jgi:hypothetical protein
VPFILFVTNRYDPDTAIPFGSFKPEIGEAVKRVPEVVYSHTVPLPPLEDVTTNRFDPDTAIPMGLAIPALHKAVPEVVYSPTVLLL